MQEDSELHHAGVVLVQLQRRRRGEEAVVAGQGESFSLAVCDAVFPKAGGKLMCGSSSGSAHPCDTVLEVPVVAQGDGDSQAVARCLRHHAVNAADTLSLNTPAPASKGKILASTHKRPHRGSQH